MLMSGQARQRAPNGELGELADPARAVEGLSMFGAHATFLDGVHAVMHHPSILLLNKEGKKKKKVAVPVEWQEKLWSILQCST